MDVLFTPRDRTCVARAGDFEDSATLGYATTLRAARFRLALSGYSLRAVRTCWEKRPALTRTDPNYFDAKELNPAFYDRVSFDEYLGILCRIGTGSPGTARTTDDEEYVLCGTSNHRFAFPCDDPMFALSAMIHAVDGASVTLDLSEMYDPDDQERFTVSGWQDGHLIVVTEGVSDNDLLRDALTLHSPDLAATVRFFDYSFRPPGGAGQNVNLLKSLAAAGVSSPIVALFDNDTSGHEAVQTARAAQLPGNFWVGTYPDIALATDYPTVGPTGGQRMDVNRTACSLEFYFGVDCLRGSDGLIPVQWSGYNTNLKRYQGKLLDKAGPQDRFRAKLAQCRSGTIQPTELGELSAIFATIEHAASELLVRPRACDASSWLADAAHGTTTRSS